MGAGRFGTAGYVVVSLDSRLVPVSYLQCMVQLWSLTEGKTMLGFTHRDLTCFFNAVAVGKENFYPPCVVLNLAPTSE